MLALLMLLSTVMMCACSNEESNEITYSVSVKNSAGEPYTSGVIVKFLQNGQQAAMQVVDANGVAQKVLPKGEYTVELVFTDTSITGQYDKASAVVTAEKPELEIVLMNALGEETRTLFATSPVTGEGREYVAHIVIPGDTVVPLDVNERSFFIFVPQEAGTYQISAMGENVQLGYYGAPHYVQSQSIEEVVDNAFTVSVSASMISTGVTGTTSLVIGIDSKAESATECTLSIKRIGDPEKTLADEPWTVYGVTAKLAAFTLGANANIQKFDLTAATDAYKLVYNETDGCYHLNTADGPMVLVNLGEKTEYLDSIKTILENTGINKYFFDENGAFIKKESYTNALLEYLKYVDEDTGVYPLTEDLKYIIQNHGDHAQWWKPNGTNYLFKDVNGVNLTNINNDIAWLFLCCYDMNNTGSFAQPEPQPTDPQPTVPQATDPTPTAPAPTTPSGPVLRNPDAPIEHGGVLQFEEEISANELVLFHVYKVSGSSLVISDPNAVVIYEGKTYYPKNGKISIPVKTIGPQVPVKVQIGNTGSAKKNFHVDFVYPVGSLMNPIALTIGQQTANIAEGNDQGVYYTYKTTAAGTLTVDGLSVTSGVKCDITLYNLSSLQQVKLADNGENATSVSIEVLAGDEIQVIVSVLPDSENKYPAAAITFTAKMG